MKQEKSCGCIIINNKDEVLLVHHNKGHWDFPKGHVEEGETEIQTATREVKEETNIDVEINQNYRYVIKYSPKENVMKEVVYFLARNINDTIEAQVEEVSEVKWFDYKKALKIMTYDDTKNILIKLKKDLEDKNIC